MLVHRLAVAFRCATLLDANVPDVFVFVAIHFDFQQIVHPINHQFSYSSFSPFHVSYDDDDDDDVGHVHNYRYVQYILHLLKTNKIITLSYTLFKPTNILVRVAQRFFIFIF
jgi:hypothetical protein